MDAAVALAKALGVPYEVFFASEEKTIPPKPLKAIWQEFQRKYEELSLIEVPIHGTVPAGYPEVREEERENHVNIPRSELGTAARGLYALRVSGDSLQGDGISDGDLVIVEPDPEITDCRIYIIMLDNQVLARHLQKAGERYKLLSSNNEYRELEPDEIDIRGRVILSGQWRKH